MFFAPNATQIAMKLHIAYVTSRLSLVCPFSKHFLRSHYTVSNSLVGPAKENHESDSSVGKKDI